MHRLQPDQYRDIVRRALAEDLGTHNRPNDRPSGRPNDGANVVLDDGAGDVTTAAIVPASQRACGVFLAKADCVVAGIDVALEAFRLLEPGIRADVFTADGARARLGETIAKVQGLARTLLTGERTALNLLQRLSGIATLTRRFVDAANGRIVILDTRKTTPSLRALEKYAVTAGGGTNHRFGLFDAILIKDNHIRLAGGVAAAVERTRAHRRDLRLEVEAQTVDEVDEALGAGADVILVDNMSLEEIRESVRRVAGRAKIEISGGVTLDRIPALAATGADYVSVGALTHSAPAVDISFEIEPA